MIKDWNVRVLDWVVKLIMVSFIMILLGVIVCRVVG